MELHDFCPNYLISYKTIRQIKFSKNLMIFVTAYVDPGPCISKAGFGSAALRKEHGPQSYFVRKTLSRLCHSSVEDPEILPPDIRLN